jgi:hypothetical protein
MLCAKWFHVPPKVPLEKPLVTVNSAARMGSAMPTPVAQLHSSHLYHDDARVVDTTFISQALAITSFVSAVPENNWLVTTASFQVFFTFMHA